jgi:hypothetical protein
VEIEATPTEGMPDGVTPCGMLVNTSFWPVMRVTVTVQPSADAEGMAASPSTPTAAAVARVSFLHLNTRV